MNDTNWSISMSDYKNVDKAIQKIRDYELIQKVLEEQKLEELIKKSKTREFWFATIGAVVGITALIKAIKKLDSLIKKHRKTICVVLGSIAAVSVALVAFCKYNNK